MISETTIHLVSMFILQCFGSLWLNSVSRAAKGFQRGFSKRERRGPMRAKRAEKFEGQGIIFGELLLALRPPGPCNIGSYEALRPWGNLPPLPPSQHPCLRVSLTFDVKRTRSIAVVDSPPGPRKLMPTFYDTLQPNFAPDLP